MTFKELYHAIRPMAARRADEKLRIPPAVYFCVAAVFSVVGGLASGFRLWLLAGFTPENSGGTLIFVLGSGAMSLLSCIIGLFWKNRAVFYGLNAFSMATVLLIILSAQIGKQG